MLPLITPVVNLNGTENAVLVEQLAVVLQQLQRAENALRAALPHGRDFPTWHATVRAREAFAERLVLLRGMHAELLDLQIAIHKQGL